MKTIYRMALRNIWRNKRRSLIVIASIAIGIIAMILSMGFMNAMNGQMIENTINTSLGHLVIHRAGFQDNMTLDISFAPEPVIISAVEKTPHLVSWAPRIKVQAMARSSESSRGILLTGIDPEKERKTSKIYDYTDKANGSAWLASSSENGAVISKALAKKLNLLPGDKIVFMVQDRKKEIIGVAMTVTGLYQTPVESFDAYMVFTGITKLQEITGLGREISEINCVFEHKEDASEAKAFIKNTLNNPSLEILSWIDMAPFLVSAIAMFDAVMYIFFVIVFITVIFSIANTLIMSIMERFHEIGVMKSIGTRPSWIFLLVMCEAINLGIIGLFAGTAAGCGLLGALSVHGLDLSMFSASLRVWGTGSILYPYIKAADIIASTVIVIFTAVLAALYPACKAARIKPLDALNYI